MWLRNNDRKLSCVESSEVKSEGGRSAGASVSTFLFLLVGRQKTNRKHSDLSV